MKTPTSDGGHSLRHKLKTMQRADWIAFGLFVAYVLVFTTLLTLQQNGFHVSALDFAKFDQAIWNTAHGRFYQTSLIQKSVIGGHFSPSLALYAPLYWIWADARLLFFVQAVLLAATGGLIYWYLRRDAPWAGVAIFFAFLTHPVLHQINFIGLRRLTLATVAVSFAFYHLLHRQYGWMLFGLLLALLSKEDLTIVIVMFGLYLLLKQRQWKVGTAVTLFGLASLIIIPFYVLPASSALRARHRGTYKHAAFHYDYLGDSPQEMITTAITEPEKPLSYVLRPARLRAVWRLTWPAAFLFLLGPEIAIFLLPYLGFLLMSTSDTLGELQGWYPSILLPLMFWAMAVGLRRLPKRWRRGAAGVLVVTAVAGWFSYSQLWPGPKFNLANTHRPTSVLSPGQQVRDVHYLDVPAAYAAAGAALRVGLYDSATGERLLPADGAELLLLPLAPDA